MRTSTNAERVCAVNGREGPRPSSPTTSRWRVAILRDRHRHRQAGAALLLALAACSNGGESKESPAPPFERTETREPCADYDALKRPLFGDLHVHTALSFDSYIWDNRNLPEDAYRFGRGEAILLEPLDETGRGTRQVQLARPLDFMADTDHAELFAEVQACIDPASGVYDLSLIHI